MNKKMKSYSTEEIYAEIRRRKILSEVSSRSFRSLVFNELSKVRDISFIVDIPGIEEIISIVKSSQYLSSRSAVTLKQKGVPGIGATYKLTELNKNGKCNLKLVWFLVCKLGMTNKDALKLLFDIKVLTKKIIIQKINDQPYWSAHKACQDYVLRRLNPANSKVDFDLMEEFHHIEQIVLVPDASN